MRFSERSKVDLPQPDGPMKAVTERALIGHVDALDGEEVAVVDVRSETSMLLAMVSLSSVWLRQRPVLGAKILPMTRATRLSDHHDDDQHQRGAPGALLGCGLGGGGPGR